MLKNSWLGIPDTLAVRVHSDRMGITGTWYVYELKERMQGVEQP